MLEYYEEYRRNSLKPKAIIWYYKDKLRGTLYPDGKIIFNFDDIGFCYVFYISGRWDPFKNYFKTKVEDVLDVFLDNRKDYQHFKGDGLSEFTFNEHILYTIQKLELNDVIYDTKNQKIFCFKDVSIVIEISKELFYLYNKTFPPSPTKAAR